METFKKNKEKADCIPSVRMCSIAIENEVKSLKEANLPVSYITDGFFFRQNDMMVKVQYSDIVWVEAGGNYSHIHLKTGGHITVVHHLGRLEEMLPERYFTRINKSEIVNLHLVDRFCGNLIYVQNRSFTVAGNYREYVFSCFNVLIRKK